MKGRVVGNLRMMSMGLLATMILGAASACGQTAATSLPVLSPPGNPPAPNYDDPTVATTVASFDEAAMFVAFPVRATRGLPTPTSIYVSPPVHEGSAVERGVIANYQTATYGALTVSRTLVRDVADWTSYLQTLAAETNSSHTEFPATVASAEVVSLAKGSEALIYLAPEDGLCASIMWREEPGVQWEVGGSTLQRDQCVQIAEML
jgi:hypothetical protein